MKINRNRNNNKAPILRRMKLESTIWSILISYMFVQCASVPKAVVDLSSQVGSDIVAIQSSYSELIDTYFEGLIVTRRSYLDDEWYPIYVNNWIRKGQLKEVANGELIWSEGQAKFVKTIATTTEMETFNTIQLWAEEAIWAYQDKEKELVEPLEKSRDSLKNEVNEAFNNLIRANAEITAYLSSLRKVREQQDQLLEDMKVKSLSDKINDALIQASKQADKGLEAIRKVDIKKSK